MVSGFMKSINSNGKTEEREGMAAELKESFAVIMATTFEIFLIGASAVTVVGGGLYVLFSVLKACNETAWGACLAFCATFLAAGVLLFLVDSALTVIMRVLKKCFPMIDWEGLL